MDGLVADNHTEASGEVKTVKCSMCRKVKTCEHFFNPNSDALFHVCDYCRFLRKTKYKKRRVRVELERPTSTISRNRDSSCVKSNRSYQTNTSVPVQQPPEPTEPADPNQLHAGIIPARKWVEVSSGKEGGKFQTDSHYALNHPYYRYQNVLSQMCTPPQVVCNEKNQVVVLRSGIPPTPKSLIFCCNTSVYGNPFSLYDKLWVQDNS